MNDKQSILAALRGLKPESEPIDLGAGVTVTLRLIPVARKTELRDEVNRSVPANADERADRVQGLLVIRILAEALAHHGLTFDEVRTALGVPVLRRLWGEYERMEALISPATDEELDALHDNIKVLVGESRSAAAMILSGYAYTELLRYAISTVGRPSS